VICLKTSDKRQKRKIKAKRFTERLKAHRSPAELKKPQRYFRLGEGEYGDGDEFIDVRMRKVFAPWL